MSALDDLLKKHRQQVIAREEATFRELLTAYEGLQRELRRQYAEIQKTMTDAVAAGEDVKRSWVSQSKRIEELLSQIEDQVVRFGGQVTDAVSREQQQAITIAVQQTQDTLRLIAPTAQPGLGSLLPTRAVENAVGMMGNGSPMLEYFAKTFAPAVAEAIKAEILKSVALGTDFRTVASNLMKAGDITRYRALSMARTEVNRVRRATTLQTYQDNSDVIEGWEWVAAKSVRTCPVCLALDGTVYDLNIFFPQHINCRCTMIPVIKGVERPSRTLGRDWFAAQPDEIKQEIIGKDAVAAYNEGIIELKDFVGYATSKEFGKRVYTRPLSQILAESSVTDEVIRTPRDVKVLFEGNAGEVLEKMLGQKLTPNEIGGLVGALDGAKVRAFDSPYGLAFEVSHPLIEAQQRLLSIDDSGRLFIHNNLFRTTRTAPKGVGLKSFAMQAHHAEKFGVQYIDTYAAGDYAKSKQRLAWNGYYSWPRMGYNAELTEDDWAQFPATFRGIEDLNALFEQVNGKFVWRYSGNGRDMIFDLDRRSASWRILEKYLQERGFGVEFER